MSFMSNMVKGEAYKEWSPLHNAGFKVDSKPSLQIVDQGGSECQLVAIWEQLQL